MSEIVRDVMQAQPAVGMTGAYQAPSLASVFLSGFSNALAGFAKSAGGGKGSDKDLASAYDYVRSKVNELDSTPTGPSEKQKTYDDTWVYISKNFGVDDSDIATIYKDTGMNSYGEHVRSIRQQRVDSDTIKQKNALTVGMSLEPNASLDRQMQLGSNYLAELDNAEVAINAAKLLTPEQQKQLMGEEAKGPIKVSLGNFITAMWNNQYRDPRMNSIPEEAALDSFKSQIVNYLSEERGIDKVAAQALVDNRLQAQQIQIYGEEYLKNQKGLEFYRDKNLAAYDKTNKIQEADMINQILDMKFEKLTDARGEALGTVTGRQLLAMIAGNGTTGSIYAAFSSLSPENLRVLMPQLAAQTKDRWTWKQMKLVLSDQGSALSQILADNPEASRDLADGVKTGIEDVIADFNKMSPEDKKAKNAYWIPAKKFIDSYVLPDGSLQKPEVVDVGYTPKDKESMLNNFFEAVSAGTNAATEGAGFYQIGEDGTLRYYGLSGRRIQNYAQAPISSIMGKQAVELKDLTNAGRVIRAGDMDAVRMREGTPYVQKGLEVLEKSFGYDKKELVESFNAYQIGHTFGGQRVRSLQIADSSRILFDVSGRMQMTPEDIKAVQEQIKGGLSFEGLSKKAATVLEDTALEGAKVIGSLGTELIQPSKTEDKIPLTDMSFMKNSERTVDKTAVAREAMTVQGEPKGDITSPINGTVTFAQAVQGQPTRILLDTNSGSTLVISGEGLSPAVSASQKVKRGDKLGKAGKSGEISVSQYDTRNNIFGTPEQVPEGFISIEPGQETPEQFLAPTE